MRIRYLGTGLIVLIVVFGGYGIFKVSGLWDDVSNKLPSKMSVSSGAEVYDPETIKGSSKFSELSEWFDIPLEDLGRAFNVPEDLWDTVANKDLENLYGDMSVEIGNGSVKLFVALYSNIQFDISEETYLPESAVDILIEKGNLSTEQLTYVNNHQIILSDSINTEHDEYVFEIKGKTTFQEVIAAGLSKDDIEDLLGVKIPFTTSVIKDFCTENNLEFSLVKEKIVEALNK